MKFGRDFRADADPLLPPLQCSMGWRLELVNVVDSMAGHITITKWVVETEVTMDKRLYCLVLHYTTLEWLVTSTSSSVPFPPALDIE